MDTSAIKQAVASALQECTNQIVLQQQQIEPIELSLEDMSGRSMQMIAIFKIESYYIVLDTRKETYGVAFKSILGDYIFTGYAESLDQAYGDITNSEE